MIRRSVGLALIAAVLVLAGCGDDGGSETSSSATGATSPPVTGPDSEAVQTAVRAYSAAFLAGDVPAARALLSVRCQGRLAEADYTNILTAAAKEYGDAQIESLNVISLAGDSARVTYTYDETAINQTDEPWVREAGAWHQDDC